MPAAGVVLLVSPRFDPIALLWDGKSEIEVGEGGDSHLPATSAPMPPPEIPATARSSASELQARESLFDARLAVISATSDSLE